MSYIPHKMQKNGATKNEEKIFNKAQIYKVEFSIGKKKYIYIGLDTKCDPSYYGSSLVIYHYQRVYGNNIFNKTILEDLTNITHSDLCAIEQSYIREFKKDLKYSGRLSINYTGKNRRDSGPSLDIPILGKAIIEEAKKIGLELRMASLKMGCIKPISPPPPFDKSSGGGMHIETNYGLKRIGFSFLRDRGSVPNIGVSTSILKELEFDDDSIATIGSSDDYQLVMATHNSDDPVHIANLYLRLVKLVEAKSDLFTNDSNDGNKSLPMSDIIQSESVILNDEKHNINRYKGNYIRVIKDGMTQPMPNTKAILRKVNKYYKLKIEDKYWLQTQRAGKAVLDKIKELKIEP